MKFKFSWNIRNTVGAVIGAISPLLFVPITIGIISYLQNFYYSLLWSKFFTDINLQCKFISLSIIANLVWFYLFLNRERYDLARGIIVGSALYLPYIFYVNLIR